MKSRSSPSNISTDIRRLDAASCEPSLIQPVHRCAEKSDLIYLNVLWEDFFSFYSLKKNLKHPFRSL